MGTQNKFEMIQQEPSHGQCSAKLLGETHLPEMLNNRKRAAK